MRVNAPRQQAFTLLEILVALGILSILLALTATGLSTARRKSHRAQCINNLKQHGLAIHSFLADHSVYPLVLNPGFRLGIEPDHSHSVWVALSKHGLPEPVFPGQDVHTCPSALKQKVPGEEQRPITGYGYNAHGLGRRLNDNPLGLGGQFRAGAHVVVPVPESAVVNPAEMVTMGDGVRGWKQTYEDGVGFLARTPDAKDYAGSIGRVPQRHQGVLVILYADGHVNSQSLHRLFSEEMDEALQQWNRDNLPHAERLHTP